MTAEGVAERATADDEYRDCGYEPELKRTLGSFQVFAVSFAFISVAVGIFATYDDLPDSAGPVGIFLWVLAAVGQTLVALVVAGFAARNALSGSSHQWASRLANPKIGWLFGWPTCWCLATAVVAMDNALAPFVKGAYVTVPNAGKADSATPYWGSNVDRLRAVKAKYDPSNAFHFEQSIPPAHAGPR